MIPRGIGCLLALIVCAALALIFAASLSIGLWLS